jgi:TPP-dependent pyruvate/acetoin dehydrogenase alpha subunit
MREEIESRPDALKRAHDQTLLRWMLRIRRFEEKRAELYGLGEIHGFLHDQRRRLSMSSKFNDFSA